MAGSTPVYGFPYPEATDLVADYPALGQELAEDIEAVLPTLGGLSLVDTTTFSAVSSVSLNNVFSADYDNYLMQIRFTLASGADNVTYRMRGSGTDNTTSNYGYQELQAISTTVDGGAGTGLTSGRIGSAHPTPAFFTVFISGPFLSAHTLLRSVSSGPSGTGTNPRFYDLVSNHLVTSSFDGISLIPGSSTITGSVSTYGYKK